MVLEFLPLPSPPQLGRELRVLIIIQLRSYFEALFLLPQLGEVGCGLHYQLNLLFRTCTILVIEYAVENLGE